MTESPLPCPPRLTELFLSFLRLGAVSFGGPAMVAYIKELAVTRKKWIPDEAFKQGVALSQAVPGATAMQCAAFVGLRTRGLAGAVSTYVGFGLPAFALMLGFSIAYEHATKLDAVLSVLQGLRAIVVALIASSAWTFARSSVKRAREAVVAATAAALFFFGGSPFLIVLAAGLSGSVWLCNPKGAMVDAPRDPVPASFKSAAYIVLFGALSLALLFFLDRPLFELGWVMMKIDLFAFGGGFASIPLMFREFVETHQWMSASMFMDGIALGQVTPGPIVITATFAGYQTAKISGAFVGTLFIFLPSFLMVVAIDPWFSRFQSSARFQGVSRGLVLSFVGLLASVTLRFALSTPWTLPSAALGAAALLALLFKVDVMWVVLGGAAISAFIL